MRFERNPQEGYEKKADGTEHRRKYPRCLIWIRVKADGKATVGWVRSAARRREMYENYGQLRGMSL